MTNSEKLRLAVAKGDIGTVKELLSRKATCDTFKDGRTLLHIASQNGRLEVVELLLQNGSSISSKDVNGYTPLQLASAQGHLEVIEFLLESGAPVDDQDQYGNTAVHMAAWNGFSNSLEMLIQFHANVNISNKVGFSALHTAAQKGHNQSARVLIYAGAFLDMKNKYGETPLHTSARHGHAGVAQILINAKARLDSKNKEGDTCLHLAASLKRNKISKLLIEAGAKTSLKNKKGETALDVAKKTNSFEVSEMLQNQVTCEEKRKKGLFNFLKRKNNLSGTSGEHPGLVDPSLPSSVGSSKNLDQNISKVGSSSGEVRVDRSSCAISSIVHPQGDHQSREAKKMYRCTTSFRPQRENINHYGNPETSNCNVRDKAYDRYNRKNSCGAVCGNYMNCWHSINPVGPHGCCPNLFYAPGYNGMYGGIPHYPIGFHYQPNIFTGGLTQSIDNMHYHKNLEGSLNQDVAFTNPACVAPPNNQPNLMGAEGYCYEFDIDADSYIYRGHQIPQHHLYEPIGSHGLHEPYFEDEGEMACRGQPSQACQRQLHATSLSGHPGYNDSTIPLEPRVVISNSDSFRPSRTTGRDREYLTASPYHLQERDTTMPKTSRRPGIELGGPHISKFQSIRRCLSDETISTVMGSSNARRKAYNRKSLRSKCHSRGERSKYARTNSSERELRMPTNNVMPRVQIKRSGRNTNERKSKNLDEDYMSSESSIHENIHQSSCRISSDKSFSSSISNEEFEKDVTKNTFQMETFEASPRKKVQAGEPLATGSLESKNRTGFCQTPRVQISEAAPSMSEVTLKMGKDASRGSRQSSNITSPKSPFNMTHLTKALRETSEEKLLNTDPSDNPGTLPDVNLVTSV